MRRGPVVVGRRGPGLLMTAVVVGGTTAVVSSSMQKKGAQQQQAAQQQAAQQQQMTDLQTQQAQLAAQQQALAQQQAVAAQPAAAGREQPGRPTGADPEALGDERPGLAHRRGVRGQEEADSRPLTQGTGLEQPVAHLSLGCRRVLLPSIRYRIWIRCRWLTRKHTPALRREHKCRCASVLGPLLAARDGSGMQHVRTTHPPIVSPLATSRPG